MGPTSLGMTFPTAAASPDVDPGAPLAPQGSVSLPALQQPALLHQLGPLGDTDRSGWHLPPAVCQQARGNAAGTATKLLPKTPSTEFPLWVLEEAVFWVERRKPEPDAGMCPAGAGRKAVL